MSSLSKLSTNFRSVLDFPLKTPISPKQVSQKRNENTPDLPSLFSDSSESLRQRRSRRRCQSRPSYALIHGVSRATGATNARVPAPTKSRINEPQSFTEHVSVKRRRWMDGDGRVTSTGRAKASCRAPLSRREQHRGRTSRRRGVNQKVSARARESAVVTRAVNPRIKTRHPRLLNAPLS